MFDRLLQLIINEAGPTVLSIITIFGGFFWFIRYQLENNKSIMGSILLRLKEDREECHKAIKEERENFHKLSVRQQEDYQKQIQSVTNDNHQVANEVTKAFIENTKVITELKGEIKFLQRK